MKTKEVGGHIWFGKLYKGMVLSTHRYPPPYYEDGIEFSSGYTIPPTCLTWLWQNNLINRSVGMYLHPLAHTIQISIFFGVYEPTYCAASPQPPLLVMWPPGGRWFYKGNVRVLHQRLFEPLSAPSPPTNETAGVLSDLTDLLNDDCRYYTAINCLESFWVRSEFFRYI